MKKLLLLSCCLFISFADDAASQIPALQHVAILKAEDARHYGPGIETLFRHSNPDVRYRAILAAGRIGDERAIEALGKLFQSESIPKMHAIVAFALGEIESIKAADVILKAIRGSKSTVSTARLVEAAGKIAAAGATDPKAAELRSAILGVLDAEHAKGAKQHRETVLLGLTAALRAAPRDAKRSRPDETDIVVSKFLANPDARVRADAGNTLARVRAKNSSMVLRQMVVSDADPIARANAARVLAAAEDKEAVDVLIRVATADVDSRVRVAAIRALATLRDAKAAGPLLDRGEIVFAAYKAAKKPDFIPAEQNEFIEIATALGRVLAGTYNTRAVDLFRQFGTLDKGNNPEVYIARLRVAPGPGDRKNAEVTTWKQYSTLAQLMGEFATMDVTTDEAKTMKSEAPTVLRPLAKAYAEADPVTEAATILAAPEVLRAYAKYKPADLSEMLRTALTNKDLFIRATAAELLAEQPVSEENLTALNGALEYAILNDTQYNDAVIGTLEALFKLDKRKSLPALELASGSLDHLVRAKAVELLNDPEFKDPSTLPPLLKLADKKRLVEVRPYSGKHTKLGQVLNSDADYRRAVGRRNGSVRALITTQKGAFTMDLMPEAAPLTVDNFIKLAQAGYFNGLEVHRVVPNFVMQDGDPRGDGNGGPGWSIRCEMNMVPYERGIVGMALSGKDTGGSQWFVTHSPQPHLDGGYTVFGRVNETGMQVVDNLARGDKILTVKIVESNAVAPTINNKKKSKAKR
ncbi:MAG TPA: peptidylprolyl isomerase [Pyrinomonadaceae bacterium]|nr:peptidylprolyl isomerase [Pyrinomonadaceae bacterium]